MKKVLSLFLSFILFLIPLLGLAEAETPQAALYSIIYQDGVDGEVFSQQAYQIEEGAKTPEFKAPNREGFIFSGWTPMPEETVTQNAVYVAQWESSPLDDGKTTAGDVELSPEPDNTENPLENIDNPTIPEKSEAPAENNSENAENSPAVTVSVQVNYIDHQTKEPIQEATIQEVALDNLTVTAPETIDTYELVSQEEATLPVILNEDGSAQPVTFLYQSAIQLFADQVEIEIIEDADLRAYIAGRLGVTTVTEENIKNLDYIQMMDPSTNVSSLKGLEHATGLTRIYFDNQSISDVSHITGLTSLVTLRITNNSSTPQNMSSISALTSLTLLNLSGTPLSNNIISSFSSLVELTYINLTNTSISDISFMSSMSQLDNIYLSENAIESVASLSHLTSVQNLWVDQNKIKDISPLAGLTVSHGFYIHENKISDISALSKQTNNLLSYIGYSNSISDVSYIDPSLILEAHFKYQNLPSKNIGLINMNNTSYSVPSPVKGFADMDVPTLSLYEPANSSSGYTFDSETNSLILDMTMLTFTENRFCLEWNQEPANTINKVFHGWQYLFFTPAYNVFYDANTGINAPIDTTDHAVNSNATVLSDTGMTKEGHSFAGWNTKADGSGTAYQPDDTVPVTGNVTLYAQWTAFFTVTYTDGVDGEEVFPDQVFTVEAGGNTPSFVGTPVREGYTFLGWSPSKPIIITRDYTFTAKWEAIPKFTVTYTDGVAGEEVFADQTYTVDEGTATPAFNGTPVRNGYTFKGWQPQVATTVTANVVYTAQWEKIIPTFTITYTDGVDNETVFTDQTYTVDEGTATPTFNGTPTRSGYTFKGWNPAVAATVTANAVYTAQWEKIIPTFTVTYTDGVENETVFTDQTYTVDEGTATPTFNGTPSRSGYTFKGWNPQVAPTVTANAVYSAQWEKVITSHTVYFESNGGTYVSPYYEVVHGSAISAPKDPVRKGYVFTGWYIEPALKNPWNFKTYGVYNTMTLYAGWKAAAPGSTVPNTGDDGISPYITLSLISLTIGTACYGLFKKSKKRTN